MPFVEVWIDDICDGDCSSAKEVEALEAQIEEAVTLMRKGHFDAALHALTNDRAVLVKSPHEIEAEYKLIKAGKSRDFLLYGEARA